MNEIHIRESFQKVDIKTILLVANFISLRRLIRHSLRYLPFEMRRREKN